MVDTAERYRRFAGTEARGHSPTYERLAEAVAGDPGLPALIDELPPARRQPDLLLGAVRFLGGPVVGEYPAFREWIVCHWPEVRATMRERRTQTNEPGRCAVLLPVPARLRAAVGIARAERPTLVRGDLNETVRELVAAAPAGATPVVLHSAVLACLPPGEREAFAGTMRSPGCPWISNEAPGVLPAVDRRLPAASDRLLFTLALNERPPARTGPHGQSLEWCEHPSADPT
ncbi:DUF2332 family protein [Streptomyces sp. NPDC047097]|uniref:DUF2332 family protein n=1 Tax=Streptomyces sp. NPDC047097 TaxID=3155260 RepID=UPI003408B798